MIIINMIIIQFHNNNNLISIYHSHKKIVLIKINNKNNLINININKIINIKIIKTLLDKIRWKNLNQNILKENKIINL